MIVTLSGPNHFGLKSRLDQLVTDFVRDNGDLALERLDGEEAGYDKILEAVQSLPFLASKKMVLLQTPGAQKQFAENVAEVIKNVPESTDLIIVEPKLDKRQSYYKTLKKETDFQDFTELDTPALSRWLVDRAKAEQGSLSSGDSTYLIERVGANQELLSHELDKLISYDPAVTRQTIDLLTESTPQSSIFELIDAAFAGRAKRTLSLYHEQRALKVEPQQIMAMLAWQLHVLAVVKAGEGRPADTIAKGAKLNPFVVRKTQNIARKLSLAEVRQLIHQALELDIRLKSQSIDADEALQHFLLTIAPH